jgi:rhamnogalacturonyl hydrolase YesR
LTKQTLNKSFDRLLEWILSEDFCGWDLFDGLNSQLFQATPFARSRIFRLAWIQLFKNSPINFRFITSVPKGLNSKGLGLFASALLRLGRTSEAERLLITLCQLQTANYSGTSWGYNFDWQSRAFFVPKSKPNIITTVFVAQAFLDAYQKTGEPKWLMPAQGSARFIVDNLIMENGHCLAYIPGETALVHNANMLGAALLAKIYAATGEKSLYEISEAAMKYSMRALREDFTWPYGERDHHGFVDNFHTGFNLVALCDWMNATGDQRWGKSLRGAYRYFLDNFWLPNGCPKYYNNSLYPIDIHCSAQGIVTCIKLCEHDSYSLEMAKRIADWAIHHMQDPDGYFYYQKTRLYTNRIPYIRWSQAWMLYAFSYLLQTNALGPYEK